eukprot:SAG25_NODE_10676_length_325_cov_2.247788_1_plen_43_part_10
MYNKVYFRRPLLPSIWLLPGLLTGRAHCLGCPWSARTRSAGQA